MFKKQIDELKIIKKKYPFFFFFVISIFLLYGFQLVLKSEITPLGYFSLYSDPAYPQKSYRQVLPAFTGPYSKPLNIYNARGAGFLMLEILPTRYEILRKSDHCNQMNHKLQRIGLHDENNTECAELKNFPYWMMLYMQRQGIDTNSIDGLMDFGFRNGKLIHSKSIHEFR